MQTFTIEQNTPVSDGMGSYIDKWVAFKTIKGYLDLLTGTDINGVQNAITEQSTHVIVTLEYYDGITDKMRVVDSVGRIYTITYSDNPVGIGHHNELMLNFSKDGGDNGEQG